MQKWFAYKKIIDLFGSKNLSHYILRYTCYTFLCIGVILSISSALPESFIDHEEEILNYTFSDSTQNEVAVIKQLYLSDPPNTLDRIDPVASGNFF